MKSLPSNDAAGGTDAGANRRKASTAEILGGIKRRPKVQPQWQKYLDQLVSARDNMARRKGGLVETAREEQPHFSLHIGDAGTDQYDQDFALSMLSADQDSIYEIEEAINRIYRGTYGVCEATGKPIEEERLEALPWTRFSTAGQRQMEEDGLDNRIRFGGRASMLEAEAEEEEEDAREKE